MAFTTQVIEDGFRNYIIKVDGPGSDVLATLVDVSTLNPPCSRVRLYKMTYSFDPAGTAELFWDATTDVTILNVFGSNDADMCFSDFGGIPNNAGAGVTGDVLLTTSAHAFSMILHFVKSDPVNPM
jgi:hypothetical protein